MLSEPSWPLENSKGTFDHIVKSSSLTTCPVSWLHLIKKPDHRSARETGGERSTAHSQSQSQIYKTNKEIQRYEYKKIINMNLIGSKQFLLAVK